MASLSARLSRAFGAAAVCAAGIAGITTVTAGQPAGAAPVRSAVTAGCQLGNGVSHVIEITFDNVHFNRDNPNVLSDIEQMPALQNFIEGNGTLLSNNHTPLIAHTADDTITNYTGLYGDRQGNGLSNDYYQYTDNPGGTVPSSQGVGFSNFNYWTGPGSGDGAPAQPYSATVPSSGQSSVTPPAPWVPFTRAGCDVGDVSTSNMELENVTPDVSTVFGASSPEQAQVTADTDSFKDQETNDYIGLGVHCASGDAFCASAQAVKYGQTSPTPTAVNDVLPDEPGSYTGFQALFGHKYLQPQMTTLASNGTDGSGNHTRTVNGHTYDIANSAGNLVDLNGTQMNGQYVATPGFPGFGPISAAQSLAYVADMQESGVPVTYAYISDVHEVKSYDAGPCSPASTYKGAPDVGYADGPGDNCYYQTTAAYNAAFANFFQRLADDGITPANTEFVFAADEGDHFAGANANRASAPSCTGTPATTSYICSYSASPNQVGEEQVDLHGLLNYQLGDTATFASQPQGEAVYSTGNQPTGTIRQLERDFGTAQAFDPYDNQNEVTAKWMVDQTGEQLLHESVAAPLRVPTFTVFPRPDVYYSSGLTDSPTCSSGVTTGVTGNSATKCEYNGSAKYAWNHGYYAPEINNTWLGLVGPGVKNVGLDGSAAGAGPSSDGSANNGTTTDTQIANAGTWLDHTDIRPTLLALVGLKDDYTGDGRVLVEDMTSTPGQTADPNFLPLAKCYKQLNSSVGQFGTDLITGSTAAMESNSSGDATYASYDANLQALGANRDTLASNIKTDLFNAEFNNTPLPNAASELSSCQQDLTNADELAANGTIGPLPVVPESPWAVALPASAVLLAGVVLVARRRRRAVAA